LTITIGIRGRLSALVGNEASNPTAAYDWAMALTTLLVTSGPLEGRRVVLEPGVELVIGREDAELTIADAQISRRHAAIRGDRNGVEIRDLGSLNGTWVNGEKIERARLLHVGDTVEVGGTSLEVEAAQEGRDRRTVRVRRGTEMLGTEAPQGDELRRVTALFADVVGSTGLGERLRPEEVKSLIGDCVTRMSRAVEQYGGAVQAYMGDGIAAFFGVPAVHEDDAERAARAALRILEAVEAYARDIEGAWGIADFNVRVGINTGQAAVGLVGARDPQRVSLGDTTNVAARLQGTAQPGTISIGEETARALAARFVVEPLGDVSVKGRESPVRTWRLVRPATSAPGPPSHPLVDRKTELAQLSTALDEVEAGRGQTILLVGDAGIGKTRLLDEVRGLATPRVTWLEGHSVSYGEELLLTPFVEILRTWLGVAEDEAEVATRMKIQAKLGALLGARADSLRTLARLLSVRLEPEAREDTSAALAASDIREAYVAWLEALSEHRPTVVVVEDLQWADAASCDLALDVVELTERVPLLLATTLRPDPASAAWRLRGRVLTEYPHRVKELGIGPLDDAAAEELLVQLFTGELNPIARQGIVARAEGNPLYLQELLRILTDGGGLERERRSWGLTSTSSTLLSPALESLLVARIDHLPDSARRLAQAAAVIGRTFPVRVLERVSGAGDVRADLQVLLRAEIIREHRRYPEFECIFKHGLLQEAALSTLTAERRRDLYGRVAAAFEVLFDAPPDDYLERLAHYYAHSDDLAKALDYLERAGERAALLQAEPQAVELWTRSSEIASRLGDTAAELRIAARLADLGT
jgi:class 3 adenylate cyclase